MVKINEVRVRGRGSFYQIAKNKVEKNNFSFYQTAENVKEKSFF